MADRKNLGQVLEQYGRISPADQESALEYQREHGGYFGEALVALGIITHEELEFGLAAQFDLPYVFPEAEAIDHDAAQMVSPEWALAHGALPIARTPDALTVVVDSPLKAAMVQELEARTGLEIDLAIASPGRIRELIRHVFGSGDDEEVELRPATGVDDFLDEALASGALRMGVSLRARKVMGWWEEGGRVVRRHLTSGWPGALQRRMRPELAELRDQAGEPREARLEWGGTELPVRLRRVSSESGEELVLELRRVEEEPAVFDPPPASIIDEVRLLVRSGAGRFLLRTEPDSLGVELLPHLPRLLLGPDVRAVHLRPPGGESRTFSLDLPEDPKEAAELLERCRAFRLDCATARLGGSTGVIAGPLARAAGAVIALADTDEDAVLGAAGFRWLMRVSREEGERLRWTVRPIATSAR